MARVYTITSENATVSASADLVEISPADDKPCWILGVEFDNVGGINDAGDAGEEFLRLAIIRGHTSSGSGGAAATPVALDPTDAAASFSAEVNNTAFASGGSTTTPWAGGLNVRAPGPIFFGDPTNRTMCPKATQANTTMVLRLLANPQDSLNMSWTVWVLED